MTLHPRPMRRSHYLLAGAVVVAGAAALVGNRTTTPALVRGEPFAPLHPDLGSRGEPGSGADPRGAAASIASSEARPGAEHPVGSIADLIDLDRRELTADGAHFEAPLKDGRRAVLTLDPALQALAEKLLSEARAPRGAIVAMAPDGRILALAGRRSEPAARGAKETAAAAAAAPAGPAFDWRPPPRRWGAGPAGVQPG